MVTLMKKSTWSSQRDFWWSKRNRRCVDCTRLFMVWRRLDINYMNPLWHNLSNFGYSKIRSSDLSIFFKCHNEGDQVTKIILVYVDDVVIFGSLDHIWEAKHLISSIYKHTNVGEIKQVLCLHLTNDFLKKNSIHRSNPLYITHSQALWSDNLLTGVYTLHIGNQTGCESREKLWLTASIAISATCQIPYLCNAWTITQHLFGCKSTITIWFQLYKWPPPHGTAPPSVPSHY